ncbi:hypothetical protein pb186bvf_020291 [Paramecium bursaria]
MMQQKVKVPKKHKNIEIDESDIFTEAYETNEISEEEVDEDDEIQRQQAEKQKQEALLKEQLEIQKRQEEERQKQIEMQRELEAQKEKESAQKKQKEVKEQKKQLIDYDNDEEEQVEIQKPKKQKKKVKQPIIEEEEAPIDKEQEILEILNDSQARKKITLKDFEELEVLKNVAKSKKQKKPVYEVETNYEYDESTLTPPPPPPPKKKQKQPKQIIQLSESEEQEYELPKKRKAVQEPKLQSQEQVKKVKIQSDDFEMPQKPKQEEKQDKKKKDNVDFISRIPAQSDQFIHFKNPKNSLDPTTCSPNLVQQKACVLCDSDTGYQLDEDNWYLIGLQHGYKKEFLQLLDQTKELLGEGQLYLSFSSENHICLVSETLKSQVLIEDVLRKFADRSIKHFIKNEIFQLPEKLEASSFKYKANYANKQFLFQSFQIKLLGNIIYDLSNGGQIRVNQVEFQQEELTVLFKGIVKSQQGEELQFSMQVNNGDQQTQLNVINCSLPQHIDLLSGFADLYFGDYFKESIINRIKNQNFKADLTVLTDSTDGKFKMRFALKKK